MNTDLKRIAIRVLQFVICFRVRLPGSNSAGGAGAVGGADDANFTRENSAAGRGRG